MKKILIIFLFLINFSSHAENMKIYTILTIDNKIITNVDLFNEIEILKILNSDLLSQNINFEKNAIDNLINNNLKLIELGKKKINIDEKYIINQYTKLIDKLKKKNLKLSKKFEDIIYSKIKLETEWNKLIVNLYSSQVNINMQEVKKKLIDDNDLKNLEIAIDDEKNKKLYIYSKNHLDNLKKNSLIKFYK